VSPLLTLAAWLTGGLALVGTGWRMELASVRAVRAANEPPAKEGANDDQPPLAA
jgi:F0F1-type ATP synthase membrane subunit c/vacuolar-type H+-ATPase subunit K